MEAHRTANPVLNPQQYHIINPRDSPRQRASGVFFQAITAILQDIPGVSFYVGHGRATEHAKVHELGIAKHQTFAAVVFPSRTWHLYQHSDILSFAFEP